MRIVHISNELPFPLDRGAPIRGYHLLRGLADDNDIALLSLTEKNAFELEHAVEALSPYCNSLRTFPTHGISAVERPLEAIRYAIRGVPIELRAFSSVALADAISSELEKAEPDVIAIEHPSMMPYIRYVPESMRGRTVLLSHDVDFSKFRRLAALEPGLARRARLRLNAFMLRRWEPTAAERFARYTTVSDRDRDLLLAANSRLRVSVIPNGVDVEGLQLLPEAPESRQPHLLFIGNLGYRPNIDGVTWLARDIVPRVQQAGWESHLDVVGVSATEEVASLSSPAVSVLGAVPDVRPAYQAAAVCVVPLRAGGGTRLKILEAMALGRPVVSTSVGCEGIEAVDGVHLLVADDAQTFASKIVELLEDKTLRRHLVRSARELVERRYDWRSIAAELADVFGEVAAAGRLAASRD